MTATHTARRTWPPQPDQVRIWFGDLGLVETELILIQPGAQTYPWWSGCAWRIAKRVW